MGFFQMDPLFFPSVKLGWCLIGNVLFNWYFFKNKFADVWNGRYLRNCRRTVLSKFLHDADDIDVAWRVGLANFMMIL